MLSVERAEALKSLYWDDVLQELDFEIDTVTKQLRTIAPERLAILQEKIRTLEMVKGLPDRVIEHRSP